jgi:hypothetical protein
MVVHGAFAERTLPTALTLIRMRILGGNVQMSYV